MSILIKGMDIPKKGHILSVVIQDGKVICANSRKVLSNDVIELPPHGDLIDRDKLETHHGWYNEDRERNIVQTHIQFVYANDILTAPVVIESEDGDG